MTTRTIGLALAVVLSIGATGAAQAAPNAVGPRFSIGLDDATDFALGVEGRFGVVQLAPSVRIDVRPFLDYLFVDDGGFDITVLAFGVDALFAISVGNPMIEPYAIAGLSILYVSFEDDSDTEAGFNIGGGAKFLTAGTIQPFVELRATIGDNFDPLYITGGVLFIF